MIFCPAGAALLRQGKQINYVAYRSSLSDPVGEFNKVYIEHTKIRDDPVEWSNFNLVSRSPFAGHMCADASMNWRQPVARRSPVKALRRIADLCKIEDGIRGRPAEDAVRCVRKIAALSSPISNPGCAKSSA